MILGHWWRDQVQQVRTMELLTWRDTLRGCQVSEILDAWQDYQTSGPRDGSGRLVKPPPMDIRKLVMDRRASIRKAQQIEHRPRFSRLDEEPREVCPPERQKQILEQAGFTDELRVAVKRFPRTRDRYNAMELAKADEEQVDHWTGREPPDSDRMKRLREARAANPIMQAAVLERQRQDDARDAQSPTECREADE